MVRARLSLLLLLPALATGCTIIDRKTFRSTPPPAPLAAEPPAALPPREGPPALVIIHPEAGLDLRAALRAPVAAARARKPNVAFEIAAAVPPSDLPAPTPPPPPGPPRKPQSRPPTAFERLAGPAQQVAKIIAGLGVPPTRITLTQRTDPGAPSPEIRVYVH